MMQIPVLTLAFLIGSLSVSSTTAQTANTTSSSIARSTTLTVSVSGIRNDKGQILVWVWSGPDGFPKKGAKSYKVIAIDADKAVNGVVTTSFNIAPGTYAVTILHDENKNGDMDTNVLGVPKEGYGASNNVVTHLHAPSFEQSSFQLPTSGEKISISMRY